MSRPPFRRTAALAGLLLTALPLAACGDDTPSVDASDSSAGQEPDVALDQVGSGVPEACTDAFPVAIGAPDLGSLTLLPDDWPAAPTGATLCQTSSTLDGSIETVDYATEATADEVLAAYEAALAPSHEVARDDQGLGEVLTGTAGPVVFELSTRDGAYTIAFSRG
ncbi:MAG TPA: hypothetical protein VGE38_04720 [Nocardioides sp.]|uniref:hypothetical protein n=1 Tax=Nocardioides sp. TaxID=35761 RepID=UPI002ED8BE02